MTFYTPSSSPWQPFCKSKQEAWLGGLLKLFVSIIPCDMVQAHNNIPTSYHVLQSLWSLWCIGIRFSLCSLYLAILIVVGMHLCQNVPWPFMLRMATCSIALIAFIPLGRISQCSTRHVWACIFVSMPHGHACWGWLHVLWHWWHSSPLEEYHSAPQNMSNLPVQCMLLLKWHEEREPC